MVGHQAIGPDGAARCRADQSPIEVIIVGLEKHRLAPIAALADLVRQVRHNNRAIRAMPALAPADLPMFIAAWRNLINLSL